MDDGGSDEQWRTGQGQDRKDLRPGEERRSGGDRRSGLERRGSGCRAAPSPEPRPYGFREFRDRRSGQDRRLYGIDGGCDRRSGGADVRFVTLTREELMILLADLDR